MQIHVVENYRSRHTINEFWFECLLHLCKHGLTTRYVSTESNTRTRSILSASIGSHDKHHIPEICLLSLIVGQSCIIHHLQQYVIYVLVSFLDFVQ